ncbi:MAG: hypothetical protein ABFE13_26380 [Phycisphaerales bacterium]
MLQITAIDELLGAVYGWTWCTWIRAYLWVKLYWPVTDQAASAAPDAVQINDTLRYPLLMKQWTADG